MESMEPMVERREVRWWRDLDGSINWQLGDLPPGASIHVDVPWDVVTDPDVNEGVVYGTVLLEPVPARVPWWRRLLGRRESVETET